MSTATSTEGGYKSASFVFDSYAYVRRLRDAGMDEQQAAIQAETFMALAEDRLATKQDIAELKGDIETTKAELQKDIALARVTTIQWTAGMFAAQTALILAALFATGRVGQPTAQQPVYQPSVQELRQPAPAPSAPLAPPPAPTR